MQMLCAGLKCNGMENKNFTISTVRGIAIILVVYGHVIQHTMVPRGEDFFLNPIFRVIYTFHMPLFVFISGYLIAVSFSRRSVLEVFKMRCQSLLVPFISWGFLVFMANCFLSIVEKKNVAEIIHWPLNLIDQLLIHPLVWFLFTLFVLSCVLLCCIQLETRFGIIIFAILYGLILLIPYNCSFSLFNIKWFYPFYAAGYFSNRYKLNLNNPRISGIMFAAAVVLFAVLIQYWTNQDYIYINKMSFDSAQYWGEVLRFFYRYLMGFLGILITFIVGKYISKKKAAPLLDFIGRYSLDIYLIQIFILEAIYPRVIDRLGVSFNFNGPVFLAVYAPLAAAFFIGLCLFLSTSLIKRNEILNRFLLGGRE